MTRWRKVLTLSGCLFGNLTLRCTSGSNANSNALSKGFIPCARFSAVSGDTPRGSSAGRTSPVRWTIAAVDARIAARRRFRDGSNPCSRADFHSLRLLSELVVFGSGVSTCAKGASFPVTCSSELADAVDGTNSAVRASAPMLSSERLNRGLKVVASYPTLYEC